jgi:hypothetical protein
MSLKLRPTGLSFGIDKDRPDYTVFTGEWKIGRIFETRGQPENLRWFWSCTINGPMMRSGRVPSRRNLSPSFRRAGTPGKPGRSWKRWIGRHRRTLTIGLYISSCRTCPT